MTGNGTIAGFSETGSQLSWRRFDIKFGFTKATAMPRHKGSKDLKPRAQQRAARPRGIPLTEGIAHQPSRGGKLPPIGNGRDPLLEVSPERSPWTPVDREEDIVDEARRRMRDEHSSKPTIVRPDIVT
jgi:hypothetical protein